MQVFMMVDLQTIKVKHKVYMHLRQKAKRYDAKINNNKVNSQNLIDINIAQNFNGMLTSHLLSGLVHHG